MNLELPYIYRPLQRGGVTQPIYPAANEQLRGRRLYVTDGLFLEFIEKGEPSALAGVHGKGCVIQPGKKGVWPEYIRLEVRSGTLQAVMMDSNSPYPTEQLERELQSRDAALLFARLPLEERILYAIRILEESRLLVDTLTGYTGMSALIAGCERTVASRAISSLERKGKIMKVDGIPLLEDGNVQGDFDEQLYLALAHYPR